MLKTEEVLILEEQWKEFRNKKIFKKILIAFSVSFLILLFVLLYLVLNTSSDANPKDNISLNSTTNEINHTNITQLNNTIVEDYSNSTVNIIDNKENTNYTLSVPIIESNTLHVSPQIMIEPPEEKKIIIETNNIQNINELIKKFEDTNNIVFANMISEEFYEKKDYHKSLEYALKANEIDSKNELSWIVFAKSQVKLGKKEDAIKALEVFIKSSKNSQNALSLLQKIKNGEFR
ncbi:MAG: CDC27 family protein [Campylobacteraceae bacterium]|jgi:tetratricopeptide (TPR) repeat protein|nr:CDC27 family protein [Campylobacteraceae bacterium]